MQNNICLLCQEIPCTGLNQATEILVPNIWYLQVVKRGGGGGGGKLLDRTSSIIYNRDVEHSKWSLLSLKTSIAHDASRLVTRENLRPKTISDASPFLTTFRF